MECRTRLQELVEGSFSPPAACMLLLYCSASLDWLADVHKNTTAHFQAFCGCFNKATKQWTLFGSSCSPHTLSQFVWIDSKSSQEETIMQKGGWTLPCKEPLGWFLLLKQSYDSLSHYVAKSLCWKQWTVHSVTRASSGLPPLHDKSVIQCAMSQIGWSNQQHLTTLPPSTWGMLQSWRERKTGRHPVCVDVWCVFVCECNGE